MELKTKVDTYESLKCIFAKFGKSMNISCGKWCKVWVKGLDMSALQNWLSRLVIFFKVIWVMLDEVKFD
jgi:hypothetical protein